MQGTLRIYASFCIPPESVDVFSPPAMYFRNPYMAKYEECPDAVLDIYHLRNISEGINSYLKNNLGLDTHVNGKGIGNIDIHVTQCCITLQAVALTTIAWD